MEKEGRRLLFRIMENHDQYFTASLALNKHPIMMEKLKLRQRYYITLEYFVKQFKITEYSVLRLKQYQEALLGSSGKVGLLKGISGLEIRSIVTSCFCLQHKKYHYHKDIVSICQSKGFRPWQKRYGYWILCDIALILWDEFAIQKAADLLKRYLKRRQKVQFDKMLSILLNSRTDIKMYPLMDCLISQYRKNNEFVKKRERRFIVTANMSAGKSTLINALIGKRIVRTSQKACTGNLCYIYNKPFEDGHVHLLRDSSLNMDAAISDLVGVECNTTTNIASYFRTLEKNALRICMIDTPGVNYALNENHEKIAKEALINENYNKLIYILNANKLGTNEELQHLRWATENVPKEKIIFVLNKLDTFHCEEDNIDKSIKEIREDLLSLDYDNPIICPISAYFALLIKLKYNGEILTDDEEDEYMLYTKKFNRPIYDLSVYYDDMPKKDDSEELFFSKKCGLYGLEKILFGGTI